MEVKIGVQNVAREIMVDTASSSDEVLEAVSSAVTDGGMIRLEDQHGKVVLVPASALGYVEIGEPTKGRVGFGA